MTPLLAQATPDAFQLQQWMLVAALLISIFSGVATIATFGVAYFRGTKIMQPLTVRGVREPATKDEVQAVEKRLDVEIKQLHGRVSGLRTEVTTQVGDLARTIEIGREKMNDRIDAVPGRVIDALLKAKELNR